MEITYTVTRMALLVLWGRQVTPWFCHSDQTYQFVTRVIIRKNFQVFTFFKQLWDFVNRLCDPMSDWDPIWMGKKNHYNKCANNRRYWVNFIHWFLLPFVVEVAWDYSRSLNDPTTPNALVENDFGNTVASSENL